MSVPKFDYPYNGLDAHYSDSYAKEKRETHIPYHLTVIDELPEEERNKLYERVKNADLPKDPEISTKRPKIPPKRIEMINLLKYIDFVPGRAPSDEKEGVVELIKETLIGKLVLTMPDGEWYRIKSFVSTSPYKWLEDTRKKWWEKLSFRKSTASDPVPLEKSLAATIFYKHKIQVRDFECFVIVESMEEVNEDDPSTSTIKEWHFPLDVCYICCAPKK